MAAMLALPPLLLTGTVFGDDASAMEEEKTRKTAPSITIDPPSNNNNGELGALATDDDIIIIINGKTSGSGNSKINQVEVRAENATYEPATPVSPGDWSAWTYHYHYSHALPTGVHEIVARATDSDGNRQWYVMPITVVSQAQDPGQTVHVAGPLPSTTTTTTTTDRFGIAKLYPTAAGGLEWSSSWDNGNPRQIGNEVDPGDSWFDTDHGEGTYVIDGKGTLTASGNFTRMYVHDPANVREWSENLEITVYVNRINETQLVDYSGPEIFARTNHGTNADENVNLCDDRGYGGVALSNGKWAFVKEIAHHLPNGYVEVATERPWGGLPKDTWVGIKFVLRNMDNDTKVKLELYRDMTAGLNGGKWEKMTEFVDNGTNFGVGMEPCKSFVNPAMPLIHSFIDASSETKKPMLSVYIRSEFAAMGFSNFTIREINPLP